MSIYEARIREQAYNRGYEEGVKNGEKALWNKILLAIDNAGGYTLLFNAVNGTPDFPNGFAVEVHTARQVSSGFPIDRTQIDWREGEYATDNR